jgi:adenylosuccinate lyase
MIPRYEISEISQIWSEENKFQTYLNVEFALLKSLSKNKMIPTDTVNVFKDTKINLQRIHEIEEKTGHDVIAFTESITEQINSPLKKYFHFGCTSSDIIDTTHSLLIKSSLKKITDETENLLSTLKKLSLKYKDTLCLGRSHGIYAEPMSFGAKFLLAYSEVKQDLKNIKTWIPTGKCSGAVGNYTILTPQIEADFCELLELSPEPISTQIIGRRKFADLIQKTTLMASSLERLAIELRHLQHSDIKEVFEGFSSTQKGSSTMPHKKNPISAENISGLCRYLRSHNQLALENILLWHERDISHSSNERLYLPDHFGILLYVIRRTNKLLNSLTIDQEHMENKVFTNFQTLSSLILHELIQKTNNSREELYKLVQEASFYSQDINEFIAQIQNNSNTEINLKTKNLKEIYTKNIDELYTRVLNS